MAEESRILLIEDDPSFAFLLREVLEENSQPIFRVTWRDMLHQALEEVSRQKWDLILLDLNLPDSHGLETLEKITADTGGKTPIVIVSGEDDEELALAAIRTGAQDFLLKDHFDPELLVRTVKYAILRQDSVRALEKARHTQIRRSERQLQNLVESITDAILVIDSEGRICFANPAAAQLFEQPLHELIGMTACEEWGLDEDDDHVILVSNDGRSRHASLRSSPFEWGGEPARLMSLRNMTDQFRSQEEKMELQRHLNHAQKMEAVGRLAAGVAHDFNNRLNVVLGYATLLGERLHDDPGSLKSLQTIINAGRQAANLTRQLLAFSRRGIHVKEPVSIHRCLRELHDMLRHSVDKRINIAVELNAESDVLLGDMVQLQNMLFNLVINACDAMPEGGDLTISTETKLDKNANCPKEVTLRISDTGCGISAEDMGHIYEPFFTTKGADKGTGLGLAAAYGTIISHKGEIDVQSSPGQGTTFSISLPLIDEEATCQAPCQPEKMTFGAGKILVVDDEPDILAMIAEVLGEAGYTVVTCADSREAISYFKGHHAECQLVLVDMVMPRFNGRMLFDKLRERDPEARIIIMSGYTMKSEANHCLNNGALGILRKPFDVGRMTGMIAEAIAQPAKAPQEEIESLSADKPGSCFGQSRQTTITGSNAIR